MMNDLVRYENDQMLIDDEAVKQIVKFERNALKINILKEQIREQALAKMEELGIDKYVSPDGSLTINYFPERTSKRLDSTKLKKELPDIYEEYLKDSTTKSYVKLTVK